MTDTTESTASNASNASSIKPAGNGSANGAETELKGTFDQAFGSNTAATAQRPADSRRATGADDPRHLHPATLLMLSRMPPLLARGVLYLIVLFIASATAWAYFSITDVVVKGQGVVIPEGDGQVGPVHSTVAAVVAEIRVKLGQAVKAGDVLFVLQARDIEKLKATVAQAELELQLKQQALKRLDDERSPAVYMQARDLKALRAQFNLDEKPAPEVDAQVVKLAARQLALEEMVRTGDMAIAAIQREQSDREAAIQADVKAKRSRLQLMDAQLKAELKQVDTKKRQTQAELDAALASLPRLQQRTQAAKAEYERLRQAEGQALVETDRVAAAHLTWLSAESELATANDHVTQGPIKLAESDVEKEQIATREALNRADVERDVQSLQSELAGLPAQFESRQREQERLIRDARANLAAVELQWAQQRATHIQERETILRDIDRATLSRDTALSQGRLDDTARIVKAPLDGEITRLNVQNPGEFVQAGQALATIAGDKAVRILQITIANKDVAKLHDPRPGQPGMPVKLKFDAYPFQTYGLVEGELLSVSPDAVNDEKQGLVYRLRATFKTKTVRGHTIEVKYGMTATAEIVQRQRSMLEVFLEPFKKLGEELQP